MNIKEMFVWIVGLTLTAGVLVSPAACTMNRHNKITEAINHGADPIMAKCAIEGDTDNNPLCLTYTRKSDSK